MSNRRRPSVTVNCVASQYAATDERIVEFSQGGSGGLIRLWRHPDGTLNIQVYRADADVVVSYAGQEIRAGRWEIASNGRRPAFFVFRYDPAEGTREYLLRPDGELRRFVTADNAQRVADKLNNAKLEV